MSQRQDTAPIFSCIGVSHAGGMSKDNISRYSDCFFKLKDGSVKIQKAAKLNFADTSSTSGEGQSDGTIERLREMRIAKATKQYVFDDEGIKYLDCFNGVAHVGHCHPQVVAAATTQMSRVATSQGFKSDLLTNYVSRLSQTLPDGLDIVYLCNSGSEANDLALRLARQFTEQEDIVVTEDAFHGNLGVLIDISPKMHAYVPNYKAKDFVHITPLPLSYRHSDLMSDSPPSNLSGDDLDEWIAAKCADKVKQAFVEAEDKGRGIAAFICEPCFIVSGIVFPHKKYYEKVYKIVREHRALIIADETQSGLGRTGSDFWGFQNYGTELVPDIVTVGRPLGSGHPIGAVITTERVSQKLGSYFSTFGGNPVSCAVGLAVLDVISNENLISSARNVGKMLHELLVDLKSKFPEWIGDVRGQGLVYGLEIVTDSDSKAPNSSLAVNIMYSLKAEKVLVGLSGRHRNVIFISPPMCFNIENCRRLISVFESVLNTLNAKKKEDEEKTSSGSEQANKESSSALPKGNGMFQGCIAGPVSRHHRVKRKQALDNNAHLFTIESPIEDENDFDATPIVEEQWTQDAKKAKMELEEYEDID